MHLISKRSLPAKPRFLFGDARNCTVKWKGEKMETKLEESRDFATLFLSSSPSPPLTSLTMGRRRAARRRRRTLSRNIHRVKMRPTKQLCSDLNANLKHLYSSSTHAKETKEYNLSILLTVRQGEEDLPPLPSLASLVYPKGRRRGGSVESGSHLFSLSSSFLFLGRELFREREASRPRPAAEECLRHPGGRERPSCITSQV